MNNTQKMKNEQRIVKQLSFSDYGSVINVDVFASRINGKFSPSMHRSGELPTLIYVGSLDYSKRFNSASEYVLFENEIDAVNYAQNRCIEYFKRGK